ncbi:hypothetical protein DFH07DRAFT_774600 [Mycena maculata]|uniref:Uncharacterized protein n=1 Tax=Mycena maculata TaxID=230809 RepID=A0AAD7IZH3_9AGAR|nr:hypothetical protein DFH07DRAFT_774600 [Mycena maculata]
MARRAIDRAQRALCRVLVKIYNIPPLLITHRFGWSTSAINRAAENHYVPEDEDVEDDPSHLPEDFYAILGELIEENKDVEERTGAEKHPATNTKTPPRLGTPKTRSKRLQQAKTAAIIRRKSVQASSGDNHDSAAPKAVSPLPVGPPKALTPDQLFLRTFIARIPLNEKWYTVLQIAGFTEETLRRTAGIPKVKVDEFIAETFPAMTQVERFLFGVVLSQLAIEV